MTQHGTPLVSSHKQGKIAYILTEVNDCVSYDISPQKIASWAKIIDEEIPDLNVDDLKTVIRDFSKGEISYNHYEGVQNIFRALKQKGKYNKMKMVY